MKKFWGVVGIYLVVMVLTFLLQNRVEMLENRSDLRNQNQSICFHLN